MKTKKIIAYLITVVMTAGLLAPMGCDSGNTRGGNGNGEASSEIEIDTGTKVTFTVNSIPQLYQDGSGFATALRCDDEFGNVHSFDSINEWFENATLKSFVFPEDMTLNMTARGSSIVLETRDADAIINLFILVDGDEYSFEFGKGSQYVAEKTENGYLLLVDETPSLIVIEGDEPTEIKWGERVVELYEIRVDNPWYGQIDKDADITEIEIVFQLDGNGNYGFFMEMPFALYDKNGNEYERTGSMGIASGAGRYSRIFIVQKGTDVSDLVLGVNDERFPLSNYSDIILN